jgi:hypothetical protein
MIGHCSDGYSFFNLKGLCPLKSKNVISALTGSAANFCRIVEKESIPLPLLIPLSKSRYNSNSGALQ